MTRYELAIATADWLEKNPEEYSYWATDTHDQKLCIIGKMAKLAGYSGLVKDVAKNVLGMGEGTFYTLMSKAEPFWTLVTEKAAKALRKVAEEQFKPV